MYFINKFYVNFILYLLKFYCNLLIKYIHLLCATISVLFSDLYKTGNTKLVKTLLEVLLIFFF